MTLGGTIFILMSISAYRETYRESDKYIYFDTAVADVDHRTCEKMFLWGE